jgi:hypothetical protein
MCHYCFVDFVEILTGNGLQMFYPDVLVSVVSLISHTLNSWSSFQQIKHQDTHPFGAKLAVADETFHHIKGWCSVTKRLGNWQSSCWIKAMYKCFFVSPWMFYFFWISCCYDVYLSLLIMGATLVGHLILLWWDIHFIFSMFVSMFEHIDTSLLA